jgi:hypothetical protein
MEAGVISLDSGARPEAMADVPGVCDLSLTRAVVQYRESHEAVSVGGSIQDIGLGLVVGGRFAAKSEVLDLGSGRVKVLDLSSELVVLDWVHQPTLEHINMLITNQEERLNAYSLRLAIKLLSRVGYGPLTRPTILRIGFRDICQDLDFHEGTSVRFLPDASQDSVRVNLDYNRGSLIFTVHSRGRHRKIEKALLKAFPQNEIVYTGLQHNSGKVQYEALFAVPSSLAGVELECLFIRTGLMRLLDIFESGRHEVIEQHLATFGQRNTLSRISLDDHNTRIVSLSGDDIEIDKPSVTTVH